MKTALCLVILLTITGSAAAQPAQMTPAERQQALKSAPAVERREQTSVVVATDTPPVETARRAAIAEVIRDYERRSGAVPGTVAYFRGATREYLVFDVAKSRTTARGGGPKVFSAVGGNEGAGPFVGSATSLMAAEVEFKSEASRRGSEELVAFKAAGGEALAGRAAKSADAPVSLTLDTAKLSATQVSDGAVGNSMPVLVTVGGKTLTLQAGQTAAFGALEVEIESSVNYSARPPGQREGPAYGLALRVRSVAPGLTQ